MNEKSEIILLKCFLENSDISLDLIIKTLSDGVFDKKDIIDSVFKCYEKEFESKSEKEYKDSWQDEALEDYTPDPPEHDEDG